jgi:hypothetical protein
MSSKVKLAYGCLGIGAVCALAGLLLGSITLAVSALIWIAAAVHWDMAAAHDAGNKP